MHKLLATMFTVLLAATAVSATAQTGQEIPRSYIINSLDRADPDKPAELRLMEEARAASFQDACDGGDRAACADLGRAYELGEGRPQNRPVAELLYRKACDSAAAEGCFRLSELLRMTEESADMQFAAIFVDRACDLGSLNGCNTKADDLYHGIFDPPDPQAAQTLRRATCTAGHIPACRTLADQLLRWARPDADIAEGLALLDRLCRAGNVETCMDAAFYWRSVEGYDTPGPRTWEYKELGCSAGDVSACAEVGKAVLRDKQSDDARPRALAFYDRACTLEPDYCTDAKAIRDEPQLAGQCRAGQGPACIMIARYYASTGGPLEDDALALAALGPACEAASSTEDLQELCWLAADYLFDAQEAGSAPDPVRIEAYLVRACDAGSSEACGKLARELSPSGRLPTDTARASRLNARLCEAGEGSACGELVRAIEYDPATPLVEAGTNFQPELTPDEEDAEIIADLEEREREMAKDRARNCTTTTVVFEGRSYTDTLCLPVRRVIGIGFRANRGEAPWQALLWRPEVLNGIPLTREQQVLCGGSVIREGWILTAAHCLTDEGGVSIADAGHKVRLGLNNPLSNEGISYPILQVIPHPDFNLRVLAFDIALVQYDTQRGTHGSSVIAPRRIRLDPLPLEQRKLEKVERVATYGWGITQVNTGLVPDHLRGARLKLRDAAACTSMTKFTDAKRRDSIICADDTKAAEGGQACSGDSGGPLITYGDADKVPTVIGVVSGGVKCGTLGKPSRYIRVAHPSVRSWLNRILNTAGGR